MAHYCAYGVRIDSDMPLSLPQYAVGGLGQVECVSAPASFFADRTAECSFDSRSNAWYRVAPLADGSVYVSWDRVGEFLVGPQGRRIAFRRDRDASPESFQVYLLGQALSFALVAQHLEPLHATVVVIEGRAVAFLGGHAFGKSTLAAFLIASGHRLLTDDVLLLETSGAGMMAHPGPGRLKLFPRMAQRFLGASASGVPMNAESGKLIISIDESRRCSKPVPLDAIYALAAPGESCRQPELVLKVLSPREGFLALVAATFNRWIASPDRLSRQFAAMAAVAGAVPIVKLSYPRAVELLPDVHDAILSDIKTRKNSREQR